MATLYPCGLVTNKYFYQLSGPLHHPVVFQPFRQLFPFLLDSLPFPWQFFPLFSHYFDHLVCLPHISLPTFMPITSFTGFQALHSILHLLPRFTFPPLANLFNSLDHFFSLFSQPVFSTYFSIQFIDHFFNPVG